MLAIPAVMDYSVPQLILNMNVCVTLDRTALRVVYAGVEICLFSVLPSKLVKVFFLQTNANLYHKHKYFAQMFCQKDPPVQYLVLYLTVRTAKSYSENAQNLFCFL